MRKFLLSILAMVCATAMAFAGEYTITFKDNGVGAGDNTAEFSQSKDITTFVTEGTDYLSSIKSTSKVYLGKDGYGLKFSSSKANGSLVLNLTESGAKKITKVVATASAWLSTSNKPDSKAAVAIDGATAQAVTSDLADYTFNFTPTENSTTLSINATERIYVTKLVVTYEDEVVEEPNLKFNVTGEGEILLYDMDDPSITYDYTKKVDPSKNVGFKLIPADGWEVDRDQFKFIYNNYELPNQLNANNEVRLGTIRGAEFTVVFVKKAEETHAITITKNGEGTVTIKDADNNEYASGDAIPASADLTLTVAPAEGWTLASAILDGTEAPMVDGTYHIGTLTDDQTLVVTFEQAPAKVEYCHPEGNASVPAATGNKGISKITVTDDKGNSLEVEGSGTSRTHALYTDATDQVLITEPGATINIQNSGAGSWMSTYVYIDYNGNGTFDFDADKCDENVAGQTGPNVDGELVSHTGYNTALHSNGTDTADPNVMCDGTAIDWGSSFNCSVPAFTLPADLAPGDYRIRHKIDWNSVNPCGRVTSADLVGNQGTNNFMGPNGGGIIDFTIRIEEPKVNTERLTVEVVGEGSVRVVGDNGVEYDPAQADIPWYTTVKLFATPAAGWSLKSVDVGGEEAQPAEDGSYLNMEIIMNCNVIVTFEENAKQMIYIYQPQNNGGKIEVFQGEKELQHQDYVAGGAELRAVATPNEGFEFSKFKHNNADVDASLVTVDEAGVATYTFNMSADAGLGIEAVFTETTGPVPPVEYCYPEGNATNANSRGVTTLVLTDSEDNTATVEGCGTSGTHKLYTDQTATVFTSAPGATVNIQVNGDGSWMMGYLYIDYNNNGTFDFDADKVDEYKMAAGQTSLTDGELVMHTGYTTKPNATKGDGIDDPAKSCDLTPFSSDLGFKGTLPTFTLPEDLKPGDYRVRYKVDWNCVDPCGRLRANGYSNNFMDANGGLIIDFTLRIEAQEPRAITVVSAQPELGSVAIIEPETEGNTVTVEGPVTIKATATDADAYFVNWTNAAGDVVSTEAEYTYGKGEEATFTANFRQHYLLTVVDAENGTTVKAGTTVVESGEYVDKGTELTVTCSVEEKILKSLMINEVEKVAEYVATGYVFTMNEATSIEVEYAMPVYEVGELAVEGEGTLVVAEGVTAEGAPSGATFAEGTELEKGSEPMVIATPAANYKIESMIVDGFAVVTEGQPLEEDEYVSTYADGLIVAYKAYIEGSLKASVKFVKSNSAIESIGADEAGDAEFFNLQGIRVARENLVPGIYIMRNAEGARKVSVK